jgi:hypothetical protein
MLARISDLMSSVFAALGIAALLVAFLISGLPAQADEALSESTCTGCSTSDSPGEKNCEGGDFCPGLEPYCDDGCLCDNVPGGAYGDMGCIPLEET